jgi:TonB family protein
VPNESAELEEEFDLIESIIDRLAEHNGVDAEVIWEDLETLTEDELYAFAVTSEPIMESQGVTEGSLEEVDRRGFLKGLGAAAVAGAGLTPTPAKAWFFVILPIPYLNPDREANACMPAGVQVGQKVNYQGEIQVVQKVFDIPGARCKNPNAPIAVIIGKPELVQAPIVKEPSNQNLLTYGQQVANTIKPHILINGEMEGNPTAEVEIKLAPDGTIVGVQLIKSSGNDEWDRAVSKAVIRASKLPTDKGKVYSPMVISFRPKDTIPSNESVEQGVAEDWQKANKRDRTAGMSQKAVNAYRRENPGSKLKTAVTTKPSKLKRGSKASKRRKSYCSRSRGQMKMHSISCAKTPDKAICKARRRWNC